MHLSSCYRQIKQDSYYYIYLDNLWTSAKKDNLDMPRKKYTQIDNFQFPDLKKKIDKHQVPKFQRQTAYKKYI